MSTSKKGKYIEKFTVFLFGGTIYALMEILFRSYTHPSMFLAGGICFLLLYKINLSMKSRSLILRGLIGSLIITGIEFIFGVIFNLILKESVWDYSNKPLNVLGQICIHFSVLWFFISIPVLYIAVFIFHNLNKKFAFRQE